MCLQCTPGPMQLVEGLDFPAAHLTAMTSHLFLCCSQRVAYRVLGAQYRGVSIAGNQIELSAFRCTSVCGWRSALMRCSAYRRRRRLSKAGGSALLMRCLCPLPFICIARHVQSPSCASPFIYKSLHLHFPSFAIPFNCNSLHLQFPSSAIPFMCNSLHLQVPSFASPFICTSLPLRYPSFALYGISMCQLLLSQQAQNNASKPHMAMANIP